MLVVVEGVDRTGKTTLCERLQLTYGGEILHFGAPRTDALDAYLTPIRDYRPGGGLNLYLDRHYLGETVWPAFFDRPSRMTPAARWQIERFLEDVGALCVLAVRDEDDLEAACKAEDEPIAGCAAAVQESFRGSARRSIRPWHVYEQGDLVSDVALRALALESEAAARKVSA